MVSQERRSIHIYKLVYLTERRSIQIFRLVNLTVPSIIKMYIVKIFIIKLYTRLYAQILLTSRQHLHERITSPRGHVWVYRTSLPPPLWIEVPVPSQEKKQSHICVLGVCILLLSTRFLLDFVAVSTVRHFNLFFILNHYYRGIHVITL